MKFKDLLFLEQVDDWGAEQDPKDPQDDNDDMNNPPLPADPDDEPIGGEPEVKPEEPRPAKPKKVSPTKQVKMNWMEQNPGITEIQTAEAVEFFRRRKYNLRPYHPYGYINPETGRHWINLPEITSLVLQFPLMETVLSQNDKMKDLKNYPWDVIDFYMDMIENIQNEIAQTNVIPELVREEPID